MIAAAPAPTAYTGIAAVVARVVAASTDPCRTVEAIRFWVMGQPPRAIAKATARPSEADRTAGSAAIWAPVMTPVDPTTDCTPVVPVHGPEVRAILSPLIPWSPNSVEGPLSGP